MTTLHGPLLDELRLRIHGSRVVVISDQSTDADAISDLFRTTEFTCVTETAGQRDPIAIVRTLRPDVVLLDLAHPCDQGESEGLALIARVRAAASGGTFLPLLAVGDVAPRWRVEALAAGADDVVLRPLVAAELLARVRNLLVTRWLHRQQRELSQQVPETPARGSAPDEGSASDEGSVPDEENFLELMVNSLEEAVVACDDDGQMRFANSAAIRLGLGTPLTGQRRAAMAPGRLRSAEGRELAIDEDPLHRAWAGHEVVDQELMIGTSQRGVRTLLANARPILAAPDRRLGAVVALHDITDRRRVTEELRRGLLEDELTGLPNAVLFHDLASRAVARTVRDHQPLSLIMITLDEAEEVRDHDVSSGPLPFNSLLAALADRLPRLLRPGDIAARYGDGFALLCGAPVFESNARHIAERLRTSLSRPLEISRGSVTPRLSVGIATTYDASLSVQGLAQIAITAARRAKARAGSEAEGLVSKRLGPGW